MDCLPCTHKICIIDFSCHDGTRSHDVFFSPHALRKCLVNSAENYIISKVHFCCFVYKLQVFVLLMISSLNYFLIIDVI